MIKFNSALALCLIFASASASASVRPSSMQKSFEKSSLEACQEAAINYHRGEEGLDEPLLTFPEDAVLVIKDNPRLSYKKYRMFVDGKQLIERTYDGEIEEYLEVFEDKSNGMFACQLRTALYVYVPLDVQYGF